MTQKNKSPRVILEKQISLKNGITKKNKKASKINITCAQSGLKEKSQYIAFLVRPHIAHTETMIKKAISSNFSKLLPVVSVTPITE